MDTIKETYAWVAYLDVFGFSTKVECSESLNDILMSLRKGHKYISEVISRHSCEVTFHAVSDSIFLVYHVEEDCAEKRSFHKARHKALQHCIEDISAISNKFVNLEIPLRGSVAYGKVHILGDNILIGKPVINAVHVKKCIPAPFILIPYKEFHDMPFSDQPKPSTNIKLKNNGLMAAALITPQPIDPLLTYAEQSLKKCAMNGPYELAETWSQAIKHIHTAISKRKEE